MKVNVKWINTINKIVSEAYLITSQNACIWLTPTDRNMYWCTCAALADIAILLSEQTY